MSDMWLFWQTTLHPVPLPHKASISLIISRGSRLKPVQGIPARREECFSQEMGEALPLGESMVHEGSSSAVLIVREIANRASILVALETASL
ncbi:hypothetical protein L345_05132 [Ophiophagus hannah]|uniref:Uncharacterized protein n=1 Tax=Ophiophagus hannah TaxID=8665 RepID=V8P4Y4_OPHHA|nr:hypothetical protein L345_05132 [Ophiophagus hannah]